MTSQTASPVTVDLTEPSGSLSYAEILTPAGVVRVNVNLVDTRTGRPVVVVEVERQSAGEWDYDVRRGPGPRVDVVLTRRDDSEQDR